MYTAKQMCVDASNKKFIIMVIAITGECNLHCNFCAYDDIKRHKKMSYETLENLFDEVDNCSEEQNFLICWTGGEPTFDIDHLLKCQKIMLDRNYRKDKIKQAMMTNCWWAFNKDVVDKIKSMNLDIIGVSASKDHLLEVPESNMVEIMKMFDGSETTVWCYFNGKCFDLYPNAKAICHEDNYFAHDIRKPNLTLLDCLKEFPQVEPYDYNPRKDPIGFYIHPDGKIGSCCPEEGNCPCILGNVNNKSSLEKAIYKLNHAKTKNIIIKNFTMDRCQEFYFHTCRFCKEAGYDVSCFTDREEPIVIDFKELIQRSKQSK